jgi:DNA-binding NarL/FixJ family response regulator
MSTVAVAEASAVLAAGARSVLEQDGFAVWTAASLDELLGRAASSPPEIVLLDLTLPPRGATSAIGRLAHDGRTRTVVWSFEPSPEDVLGAVAAGAVGFLTKQVAPADLVAVMRRVEAGEAVLGEGVAGLLVTAVHRVYAEHRMRESLLSAREVGVLALVSEGLKNREIAAALAISEFTVKRHVQNILRKLDLPSRRAAAALHGRQTGAGRGREEAA